MPIGDTWKWFDEQKGEELEKSKIKSLFTAIPQK